MMKSISGNKHFIPILLGLLLIAEPGLSQTVQYTYDKDGRVTQVTNPDSSTVIYQYDAEGNILKVTKNAAGTFAITNFNPTSGIVGSSVTITGTGFNAPVVKFNGTQATISNSSSTSITATVPSGATTGSLTVTVGVQTLSAGTFTVLSNLPPVLTAYSQPAVGPGSSVTLTGSNFNTTSTSANTVTVGGQAATVTAVTATSITFTVPLSSVPNNPPFTPGTQATVIVQTEAGSTTATNPLYLVPRVVFNQPVTVSAGASGNLSSLGDNGLVQVSTGPNPVQLSISASNVNGNGFLDVFVYSLTGALQSSQRVPSAPFSGTNSSFQSVVNIPITGQPFFVQTAFEYDTSRGFQATGNPSFWLTQSAAVSTATVGNFSIYNPATSTNFTTGIFKAFSIYNPATSSTFATGTFKAFSIYNPAPSSNFVTGTIGNFSIYNPAPNSTFATGTFKAFSICNPSGTTCP